MADASFNQTSFLGGEWSLSAQGRTDDPRYKTALNVCYNAFPLEEGAWTRRPGFALAGPSFFGGQTRCFPFNYAEGAPYTVEMMVGFSRFWNGTSLVFDSSYEVIQIIPTTPMQILVDPACPYASGDQIEIFLTGGNAKDLAKVQKRQYRLTQISGNLYSLTDPVSNANVDGAISDWDGTTMTAIVSRVLVLTNPFVTTAELAQVKVTQAGAFLIVFHPSYATFEYGISSLNTADLRFSSFFRQTHTYSDGPYYDAVFGQVATPNGTSGSIILTLSGGFGPRSGPVASDIGKQVRLLSEPLLWSSGTTYSLNQNVLWPADTGSGPGNYYTSLVNSNAGHTPDTSPDKWAISPQLANWTYGVITAVPGPTQITVTLQGGNLFYSNPINFWRLGIFAGQDGYPTAGAIHEGRLWPVFNNKALASRPFAAAGSYNDFAPTDIWGTVNDSSAINYTLNTGSEDSNQLFWGESGPQGLLMGSAAGEWLIQASSLNDPITPTSIQARRITRYGCSNIAPVRTGLTVAFVQRYAKRILEMLSDVFTGKFAAPNLSLEARHIGRLGFSEISYQETPLPIVWTRDTSANLAGVTYRRLSSFITEQPTFVGWHRHQLGLSAGGAATRGVVSMSVSPTTDGTGDALTAVTHSAMDVTKYSVQVMQPMFVEGSRLDAGFFLDDARAPTAMVDNGAGSLLVSGFFPLVGATVTAFIAGLNCGTYVVDATGSITVPYQSDADHLLTQAYLLAYPSTGVLGASTGAAVVVATPPASYSATPATIGVYAATTLSTTLVYPDWSNSYFWFVFATGAIKSYNVNTRASIASVANASINSGNGYIAIGPGHDGNLWIQHNDKSHGIVAKMTSAGTQTSVFGTDENGSPHPYYSVPASTSVQSCIVTASDLFLVTQDAGVGAGITVIDLTSGKYADFYTGSGIMPKMSFCRGRSGTVGQAIGLTQTLSAQASVSIYTVDIGESAAADIITYDAWQVSGYAADVIVTHVSGVWKSNAITSSTDVPGSSGLWDSYTIPNQAAIKVNGPYGTVAAAAIDAGWTTFQVTSFGYDQIDGNILAFCQRGAGAGSSSAYLVKIRPSTAAVLWKIPLASLSQNTGLDQSNINTGVLGMVDATGNYYSINTIAGTVNLTFLVAGAIPTSNPEQLFNGTSKLLYTRYASTTVTGSPTLLSGTTNPFTDWGVYAPFTAFDPTTTTVTNVTVPALVGLPYTSQGQLLRTATKEEAGSPNGPPLGKTRRIHMFGTLLVQTVNISFGTDFTKVYPVAFKSKGGTLYAGNVAYSGVHWNTLADDYGFDGQLCWQSTGPYPATVASVAGFLHTQDR